MIQRQDELEGLIDRLKGQAWIAIDTEANSLHSYFEKLCLIQISIPGEDYLVDPLSGIEIAPLLKLLAESNLVLHAMDFDLKMLRRVGDFQPRKVFDTSIAGKLLGYRELGLAALLKRHFGLEISKASQKEDWGRRPLPPKMIEYAMTDTRHLLDLREILRCELLRLGRMSWFEESCHRAVLNASSERERDMESAWRVSGWMRLSPRGRAVLRALWQWREQEAMKRDRPSFYVINNEEMVRAAEAFDKGETFSSRSLRGGAMGAFYTVAQEALVLPESSWPSPPPRGKGRRVTPEEESQIAQLKGHRDKIAAELDLDPSVIAPRVVLEGLILNRAETQASMLKWQYDLLEPALHDVLNAVHAVEQVELVQAEASSAALADPAAEAATKTGR
ncbi:MAG: HRDC domain-containing protein [Verrucomicrobiia bacterium]